MSVLPVFAGSSITPVSQRIMDISSASATSLSPEANPSLSPLTHELKSMEYFDFIPTQDLQGGE